MIVHKLVTYLQGFDLVFQSVLRSEDDMLNYALA
jgi:hypothetical protein